MKIVKASHEYMPHHNDPRRFIELVGRTCYKSTDKITDDSATRFVNNLIERSHKAMLEHETIYIETNQSIAQSFIEEIYRLNVDPAFFHISYYNVTNGIISGSITSFFDLFNLIDITYGHIYSIWQILNDKYSWVFGKLNNKQLNDDFIPKVYHTIDQNTHILSREEFISRYSDAPTILFKHLTHTIKFICDRGVSHELVRHRPCSFAQESTRYCNYSKDKFGQEITVVRPCFFEPYTMQYKIWEEACYNAETAYFDLIANGASPQEARDVLPNSLKTEIIVTATEQEWQHIVNLRAKGTTGKPHPQMVEIMEPCYKELITITDGRIS